MITVVITDLAAPSAETERAVAGADVVIHAAATLDSANQQRDTLEATEVLLDAIGKAPAPPHLVLISSLSVYAATAEGGTVTEATPLEQNPALRDGYCRAKLRQEQMATAAARTLAALTILRPGVLLGPGRIWNAHLGIPLGPVLLRLGTGGQIPLCQVAQCAEAVVLAAERKPSEIEILNLVDDDLPDRTRFVAALRQAGGPGQGGWPRLVVPLPWQLFAAVAHMAQWLPGLAAALPGLLRLPSLRARMMPQAYDNSRARARLGWQPRIRFETALAAARLPDRDHE